ncbi:P-loop containing nucleoside triphosphate hydrolase protein [Ceratobasidium sp. AG-Ba]|nr:P-loop containing nucleoside triphosphate hydrolase protein [Ceratobasidium sp. AG-Ba]
MTSAPRENPYLAHLKTGAYQDPFEGCIPRKVDGAKAREIMDGDMNPFTRQPYSEKYKKILEGRKRLPVYSQMEDFFKITKADFS